MENGSTWDIRCDLIGCNQWRFSNILDYMWLVIYIIWGCRNMLNTLKLTHDWDIDENPLDFRVSSFQTNLCGIRI